MKAIPGEYLEISQKWLAGDAIELDLSLQTTLMEANPLVEETRNQVAVKRGLIIYCVESTDLPDDKSIFDVTIPATASFRPEKIKINNAEMMSLKSEGKYSNNSSLKDQLLQGSFSAKCRNNSDHSYPILCVG